MYPAETLDPAGCRTILPANGLSGFYMISTQLTYFDIIVRCVIIIQASVTEITETKMTEQCPFCADNEPVLYNGLAYARFDRYPVSPGHLLIIPTRHVSDFFELRADEREAIFQLLDDAKKYLDKEHTPNGYNIGINVGAAAGQTVWHVHVHLIPRYTGDMDDPRGGVRGVIPGKQKY